jgi:hypothetical protein
VFDAMTQAGVRADHVSYNILIDAFGRAGLTAGTNLTYWLSDYWQASIVSICKLTYRCMSYFIYGGTCGICRGTSCL